MISMDFSKFLILVLIINSVLAQNNKRATNKNISANNEPASLEKKVTIPLKLLMDDKQECPRLQELGSRLLNDPNHCDIELEVTDPQTNESRVFCAHKSILCLRSTVLNDKITELLAEHTGPQKPRLKLEGLKPDVFQYILQYIYTDKIDPKFDLKNNIMDLMVAADYVRLPDLNAMIKEYLYDSVNSDDVSNYIVWANRYRYATKDMKKFLLDMTRTALKMDLNEWRIFVRNMCQTYADQGEKDDLIDHVIDPIVKPFAEGAQKIKNLNLGSKLLGLN